MLKLTKLFFSETEKGTFIDRIVPTLNDRSALFAAKTTISEYLGIEIEKATVAVLGMNRSVTPRFRTQGSWRYDTCVTPSHNPPQEMDWDLGVYLPTTVWEENGPPRAMAKVYFSLVEELLAKLCSAKGWVLDPSKQTCSRVRISSSAHIDVPLYAAEAAQFIKIVEKHAVIAKSRSTASLESHRDAQISMDSATEQRWDELEGIVLANRSGEWIHSDPNNIAKWFEYHIQEHGEQLRRVSRYVKAWRDYQWRGGGPSSVAMMVIVARNFEKCIGRDDLALERAVAHLSKELLHDVRENGIDSGVANFSNLDERQREEAAQRASVLTDALRAARRLPVGREGTAIELLNFHLGPRIPARSDWILPDAGAEAVRRTPARTVPPPAVGATSAG